MQRLIIFQILMKNTLTLIFFIVTALTYSTLTTQIINEQHQRIHEFSTCETSELFNAD